MAQLNVRVDDNVRESLDALARARGLTASDVIRKLIDDALGRRDTDEPRQDMTPRGLSVVDRRTLALQHEALALLHTDPTEADGGWEAKYHRNMVQVLHHGFTAEYPDMFVAFEPEMSQRECSLLHHVLQMFESLERSLDRLSAEQVQALGEHAEFALRFHGFDFNDHYEARLASYARYLVDIGRWSTMAAHFGDAHDGGNSHAPMLAAYERMLTVWRPMWSAKLATFGGPDNYLFSPDELRQVLRTWPYPG